MEEIECHVERWDERREIARFESRDQAVEWAVEDLLQSARKAIRQRGAFHIALSGGSTPQAVFKGVVRRAAESGVDWERVHLYWGDERAVGPESPESNYRMAMACGLGEIGIPHSQIHRMEAEGELIAAAERYEQLLHRSLPDGTLDMAMLGMGSDGHTASLFPNTEALTAVGRWVVANEVPQLGCWRMTLTFEMLQRSRHPVIYVLGADKADRCAEVLAKNAPNLPTALPAQRLGSSDQPVLWVLDGDAAEKL